MTDAPFRARVRGVLRAAVCTALAAAGAAALAANPTVYWLEPRSNVTFDRQVTQALGKRAGLVVLRASWNNPDPDYTLQSVVGRIKSDGKAPVLSYSWANRYSAAGRSEADLLRNLNTGTTLAETKGDGGAKVDFLDVTNPEVRARVVGRFQQARRTLGVDGFAVDLSTRTPNVRPGELARRCQQDANFCANYATGMDALFADLRKGLGADAFIAYNGLFNFAPGQLKDQTRLLASANAAAIEFFGMDPKDDKHRFSEDILPFLEILPTLPPDRPALVFGRGPWTYTDYAQDFLWQRYLYASFLLAARPIDFFKYHATFQVPTQRGRSGGLDAYDDWDIDLGAARGAAKVTNGIHWREYARGLVAVAPDDGRGGSFALTGTFYTPEGNKRDGTIQLSPGEGAILLREKRPELRKPARLDIDARTMAGWKWANAQLDKIDGRDMLRVQAPRQPGDHDVLLDFERSVNPYEHVEIDAKLLDRQAAVYAVAEVDDPKRRFTMVAVRISPDAPSGPKVRIDDAVPFRAPAARKGEEDWPILHVQRDLGQGPVGVGAAAFEGSGYAFRRWSHVRLDGAVAVARITLSNPTMRVLERP